VLEHNAWDKYLQEIMLFGQLLKTCFEGKFSSGQMVLGQVSFEEMLFDHEWESHQFQIIILFLLDIRMEVRFQSAALEAVQEAAECYIVSTLILPVFCSKLGRFCGFRVSVFFLTTSLN
jgi:hypothetical protein